MTDSLFFGLCICFIGVIFYFISTRAEKKKTPMWFVTGGFINPDTITDVKEFNRENATMWRNYSVMYFAAGLIYFFDTKTAVVILLLACTVGLGWLFWKHSKIMAKYKCVAPKKVAKGNKKKK